MRYFVDKEWGLVWWNHRAWIASESSGKLQVHAKSMSPSTPHRAVEIMLSLSFELRNLFFCREDDDLWFLYFFTSLWDLSAVFPSFGITLRFLFRCIIGYEQSVHCPYGLRLLHVTLQHSRHILPFRIERTDRHDGSVLNRQREFRVLQDRKATWG